VSQGSHGAEHGAKVEYLSHERSSQSRSAPALWPVALFFALSLALHLLIATTRSIGFSKPRE
jgi:hypothetical protein